MNRKLTLNLGLRYDFVEHAKERYGAEANFNVFTNTLQIAGNRQDPLPPDFFPEIAVTRGAPASLVPNQKHDFARESVLRTTYSIRRCCVRATGYSTLRMRRDH